MQSIRVLLVGSHLILRQNVRALLTTQVDLTIVGEAGNGPEAARLARRLQPNAVVVDARMRDLTVKEIVRSIRQAWPLTEIVVLTMFGDQHTISAILNADARSHLLKDSAVGDLARGIRGAVSQKSILDPKVSGTVPSLVTGGLRSSADVDRLAPAAPGDGVAPSDPFLAAMVKLLSARRCDQVDLPDSPNVLSRKRFERRGPLSNRI